MANFPEVELIKDYLILSCSLGECVWGVWLNLTVHTYLLSIAWDVHESQSVTFISILVKVHSSASAKWHFLPKAHYRFLFLNEPVIYIYIPGYFYTSYFEQSASKGLCLWQIWQAHWLFLLSRLITLRSLCCYEAGLFLFSFINNWYNNVKCEPEANYRTRSPKAPLKHLSAHCFHGLLWL